jgi:hypothetical protein
MARGWESKSVESQQSDAAEKPSKLRAKMSPEQAAAFRDKERLRLSRQRALEQLETATNPRLRKILEDALSDLGKKLQALD